MPTKLIGLCPLLIWGVKWTHKLPTHIAVPYFRAVLRRGEYCSSSSELLSPGDLILLSSKSKQGSLKRGAFNLETSFLRSPEVARSSPSEGLLCSTSYMAPFHLAISRQPCVSANQKSWPFAIFINSCTGRICLESPRGFRVIQLEFVI
jgi:hypothetical protein